jgi:hypothetical protein
MTSFNQPLTSAQYGVVRSGGYAADRVLYLFRNRVVLAAQVNTDLSVPLTWASFSYNNVTVGSYLDVREGQVLYISLTDDITKATFYGRVRLVPDATTIFCNESSQDFSVGAYLWIIDRYDIQYKLSRPTPGTNVELVDYDIPYQGLPPRVVGLQTGYMAYVNPSSGKLRLGFDISPSEAAESGETVASYAYAFDSGTLVAGSLSGPICIMDFDPGEQYGGADVIDSAGINLQRRFGIVALDDVLYPPDTGYSNGSVGGTLDQGYTLTVPAFKDVDSVLYNSFGIAIRANEQYGGVTQSLYGGGFAAVTNKALTSQTATLTAVGHPYQTGQTVIVADVGTEFNGTFVITATTANTFSYHSAQANVVSTGCAGMSVVNPPKPDFVGWLNRENDPLAGDPVYSTKTGAEFTFTGVAPRLARLTAQLLGLILSTDTRWGDIPSLAWWRAIWHFLARYTTAAVSCDVIFSDTTDEFQFPDISTEGQDALGAIRWIAAMVNAIPEFAPWGAIAVNRDVNYLSQAERNLTTVVAAFTDADFIEAPRSIDPNQNVGKVDTDAAVYNTANSQVTVFTARAPGHAQGEASGSESLPGQALAASPDMVAALNEARQRVGQKFEIANLQEFLDVRFKAGWAGIGLIPSRAQVYTVTLSNVGGPSGVNRVEYDTSTLWTLESVAIEYDAEHGRLIPHGKLRRVADIGGPGDNTTQNIPAVNQIPDPLPDLGFPAFSFELPEVSLSDVGLELSQINPVQLLPPKGKIAAFNGSELLVWSADDLYYLKNFIALKKPISTLITPSDLGSYQIKQAIVDPFFTNIAIPIDVLASDNTNSAAWSCLNAAAPGASSLYTKGADVSGVYSVLRATKTANSIMIYSPDVSLATTVYDFTLNDQGWVTTPIAPDVAYGTYVAGVGWEQTCNTPDGGSNYYTSVIISLTIPSTTLLGFSVEYTKTNGTFSNPNTDQLFYNSSRANVLTQVDAASVSGSTTLGWSGVKTGVTYLGVALNASQGGSCAGGTIRVTRITVLTSGGGGGAKVLLSTDGGATWSSTIAVGSTPGSVGGFDTQRSGTVSYAAGAGAVFKATTLGGAYSSWFSMPSSANPVCLITPYYKRNSSTLNTSTSTPDVVAAGDNGQLLWIDGAAATATDITPPGMTAFDNANCVTVLTGSRLACFGKVSGIYHVFTSINGGTSWTDRGAVTSPGFIRCRRNDERVSPNGQLFLAEGSPSVVDYSSKWASGGGPDAGMYPRTMPISDIVGLETIY